jgi:hypothetical protein
MTQEDVVKGLECLAKQHGIVGVCEPENCPYGDLHTCANEIARDAIALLKAQEPRVMTLEEVNALDWDYCYLEQERLPGKEYRGMLGKYIMTCVTWPSITAAKISQGMDNYGKTWRCWTARPDEKRRAETPWES